MSNANRKPLDPRIPQLITNGVIQHNRSFFLIVGSSKQQHSQIVNLHYLLSQARLSNANNKAATARPNVLWCYKKELAFTSNRKKREGKIKRDVKRGIRDEGEMDPFELFVGVTDIRYCYYRDTEKILGQTYGMLVLQDFEAITPNLLARTIETVQGGGVVVLLLQSMTSLKQLYTMTMDVHSRYRTESSDDPIARFNERFILSLGSCRSSLILDDELNVLPLSIGKDIKPVDASISGTPSTESVKLKELVESLKETQPVGSVVPETVTMDQAQALLTFTDALSSKSLSSTVTLTAGRGRGKSAALGLAVALAVSYSYSNIFVTSPHPDNLATFWQFVFKGFDRLGWKEFLDYDIVKSSNKDWNEAVVRVNIFRNHRQTIQYIQPQDAQVLGQAELVVIDEAAAIPLPLVKNLMGPYLVFMASTINGYEGTGRSLSLKLIQSLRELSRSSTSTTPANSALTTKDTTAKGAAGTTRSLREIKLETPIRYGPNDAIEKWLNGLLCLDSNLSMLNSNSLLAKGTPHPSTCDLYAVNRDTLFSYHPISEVFLQKLMALFVSSHYKNSPNDLQLLSDAPNHLLFVLLPPIKENSKEMTLPEPLVVMQVALEGKISKQSVLNSLMRGVKAGGDLIPWTISQQYQDDDFAGLSGARVVRIATNPEFAKMGYGSRALSVLLDYFSGKLLNLDEVQREVGGESFRSASKVDKNATLSTDVSVRVRDPSKMPPLLQRLPELQPPQLDWIGTSYGITPQLFKFWKRAGYVPMYLRQTTNELTGEHTCVMLRGMAANSERGEAAKEWLSDFAADFRSRFLALLSYKFREFPSVMALTILEGANSGIVAHKKQPTLTTAELRNILTPHDMKRLVSYGNNMLDYHVILDLLPSLASLYFSNRFSAGDLKLSGVQSSILLALGLQRKVIDDIEVELKLPVSQALALFVKVIRKITKTIEDIEKREIDKTIPEQQQEPVETASKPIQQQLVEELAEEGDEVTKQLREQQREVIDSLDLSKYAIAGNGDDSAGWEKIKNLSKVVSIKNPDKRKERDDTEVKGKQGKASKKQRK